ncbi:hypothetical protein NDU88_006305 [Pleurodeles waltl]|uniref:Uncharacterized protein n=1 Tax=Pleurodeles waltl TaxID=8319 RepID=A0AAV7TY41_PLEWA|nr:hypothetical protein NDU88_006305 [Pleurodeles waltl]
MMTSSPRSDDMVILLLLRVFKVVLDLWMHSADNPSDSLLLVFSSQGSQEVHVGKEQKQTGASQEVHVGKERKQTGGRITLIAGRIETEAKVLEAVALLHQAGRLDLLKDGTLAPTCPARKASAGVAAAVAACSPPRVAPAVKVRGAASGVVTKGGSRRVRGASLGGSGVGNPRRFLGERDALGGVRAGSQLENGGRAACCSGATGQGGETSWGARAERREKGDWKEGGRAPGAPGGIQAKKNKGERCGSHCGPRGLSLDSVCSLGQEEKSG